MSLHSTPEQKAVIEHQTGHAIVSAVAGSGKSATLVERVARLLEHGVDRDRILVLMFNKSACDDFRTRVARRVGDEDAPEVFTFHGFGLSMCERLTRAGGLPDARLVTDQKQARMFAREVLQAVRGKASKAKKCDFDNGELDDFLSSIDLLKGSLFRGGHIPGWILAVSPMAMEFDTFERMRREKGVRFFSDLIYDPMVEISINPQVADAMRDRYDHILVDEFQDINDAQMEMIHLLAGPRASVMAVGDEDQTIYGWRGARPDFMMSVFEQQFAPVSRYQLSRTFRYGHALSFIANSCISNNPGRSPTKLCMSQQKSNTDVVVRMHTEGAGKLVVEEIKAWHASGGKFGDVAILVREFANAFESEFALLQAGIPVRVVGSLGFAMEPEVLVLRGYLELAAGQFAGLDDETFCTILNALLTHPKLYYRSDELATIRSRALRSPDAGAAFVAAVRSTVAGSKSGLAAPRERAAQTFQWARRQQPELDAATFLQDIIRRTDLMRKQTTSTRSAARHAEKARLLRSIIALARSDNHTITTFCALLNSVAAAPAVDDGECVLITSIHRSKGLEYPCVVMPDLAEGAFPSSSAMIEDERRLFYVGVTRARKKLVLVSPVDSTLVECARQGIGCPPIGGEIKASRFLYESNLAFAATAGHALEKDKIDIEPPTTVDDAGRDLWKRYVCSLPNNCLN